MQQQAKKTNWLKQTLSDNKGAPSFKRQISLLLVVSTIAGMIAQVPIEYIQQLVILTCACIGSVATEQFTKH